MLGTKFQRRLITVSYWSSTFCEGAARILIPLYFAARHVPATKIAFLFFVFELSGLLTNLLGGMFVNRYGYRRAFLLSLLLHSLASLGYCFATSAKSALLLGALVAILRAFRGIAKELIKTTSSAYFRRLRRSALDAQILWGGKDSVKGVGLLSGGVLLSLFSFEVSFALLAVPTTLALIIASCYLNDHRDTHRVSVTRLFAVRDEMKLLAAARALLYAGRDIWLVVAMPVYLISAGFGNVWIAAIPALGLITFGLIQPLSMRFALQQLATSGTLFGRGWTQERILPWSALALAAVPLAMLLIDGGMVAIFLCVVVYNVVAGVATVPHNELHMRYANSERAAVDIAYYKAVSQVGKTLAVLVSGVVYDRFGLTGCLATSAVALCGSALLGWILQRHVCAGAADTPDLALLAQPTPTPAP